jgi:stress response protein YsnF
MIIPVVREVLVVEKRLLLVEELHVTKTQVQKQETQHITLRKEEVIVERLAPNQAGEQPV